MNKKRTLILSLSIAIISAAMPASFIKAEEISAKPIYNIISAPQGITTNQLKPYVLNEKEIYSALGTFVDELDTIKLNSGFYVIDKEKYGIKDSDVYVMISLGQRKTTGYGVKVVSAEDIEGTSKITIQEITPSPDMIVGYAVAYPYVIVGFAQGTPNVKVVTDSGVELSALVNPLELKQNGWYNLGSRTDVSSDKEWLVTFNIDILNKTVSEDIIYVRDSSGKKVPVEIIAGENKNTFRIIPVEKYIEGETYYLFISDKIQFKDHTPSKQKGYRMKFTIGTTVAVE
jgi:hypothetical protein